jgi:ribosomal protein L18
LHAFNTAFAPQLTSLDFISDPQTTASLTKISTAYIVGIAVAEILVFSIVREVVVCEQWTVKNGRVLRVAGGGGRGEETGYRRRL